MLHREFENMQKSGTGAPKEQFELLKQALAMSTFALNLREPSIQDHTHEAGVGRGQGGQQDGAKRADKGPAGSEEERTRKVSRV